MHNLADQPIGHSSWEVPIGNITQGLDVVRSLFGGYGDEVDQVNGLFLYPLYIILKNLVLQRDDTQRGKCKDYSPICVHGMATMPRLCNGYLMMAQFIVV